MGVEEAMKYSVFLILLILVSLNTFALPKLPSAQSYESGRFLCQDKYKENVKHENGFYVTVPVSYQNPSLGNTEVYAYFNKGYVADRPTLLYFTGGPGQGVHWGAFRVDMDFNILMVENRGYGCSRPATVEQYLNPAYYASENVARDAEKIRQFVNIPKVTVYGISYGTVPATIYGSLFPNSTRAVILEGTVNSGDSHLWEAPHRRKLLQKMIDTLPVSIKERLMSVSSQYGVPDTWLGAISRDFLMSNNGLKKLKEKFLTFQDEKTFLEFVKITQESFMPVDYALHPLFAADEILYSMIACQELGRSAPNIAPFDSFVNGKLIAKTDLEALQFCQTLKAAETTKYLSQSYPLRVPVTYFQGGDDGATASPEAIKHYKQTALGPKQLLILVRGGHNPNLYNLAMEFPGQKEVFDHAFRGEKIPAPLLQKVRADQELFWAYTSKNF